MALEKRVVDGKPGDYLWSAEDKVATRELRDSARVVTPFDEKTKTKYRICMGRPGDRLILMKKVEA